MPTTWTKTTQEITQGTTGASNGPHWHHKHRTGTISTTGTTGTTQALQGHYRHHKGTTSKIYKGVNMSYFPRININTNMVEVVDNLGNIRYEIPENDLKLVYQALGVAMKYPLTLTRVRNITFNDLQPLINTDN